MFKELKSKMMVFVCLSICLLAAASTLFAQDEIAINTPITPHYSGFVAEFDVTPSHDSTNAVVALTQGESEGWGDMSAILQIPGKLGYFKARNGGGYEISSGDTVTFAGGGTYHIMMVGNVMSNWYDVFVDGVQIADSFAFRTGVNARVFDNLATRLTNLAKHGATNANVAITNVEIDIDKTQEAETSLNIPIQPVYAGFVAEWDITPTHDSTNAVVALTQGESEGWGDMSAILQIPGKLGYFKARNGGGYEISGDDTVSFVGGGTYHVMMVGNVSGQWYDVFVDGVQIADSFACRTGVGAESFNNLALRLTNKAKYGAQSASVLIDNIQVSVDTTQTAETIINDPIDSQYTVCIAEWDMAASVENTNGAVGLCEGENGAWGDYSAYVRFVKSGYIDARDGGGFATAGDTVKWIPGEMLHVKLVANVPANVYSAWVNDVIVADNFAFRKQARVLNNLARRLTNQAKHGAVGAHIAVENFVVSVDTSHSDEVFTNTPIDPVVPVGYGFSAEFDLTPTHEGVNGIVGFSQGPHGGWSDLSCYVRCSNGYFDARDGGGFNMSAEDTVKVKPGEIHKVKIEANVTAQTYDAWVDDVLIADDFAFRAAADTINNIAIRATHQTRHGAVGAFFLVDNMNITIVEIPDTGVNDGFVPKTFTLQQNYPNPFNPETSISYSVPVTSEVKVRIFNMAGQLVRTLVEKEQIAGLYTVKWNGLNQNGSKVSSGVYVYQMEAGSYLKNHKMILMK